MVKTKRVLDVGQCGFDGPRLGRFLTQEFDCAVDRAHTKDEALRMAAKAVYDLVLVNRMLAQDGSPGLDVIKELRAKHATLRLMLISDRADAQEEAVRAGAMRGFGKAVLAADETQKMLCNLLCGSAGK